MSLLNAVAETTQPTIFSHFMNLYNKEIRLFCRQLADPVLQTLVPPIIVGKFICLLAFSLFFHSDVTICSGLRLQHHSGFPQSHRVAFYKEKHISRHSLVWSYFCLADGAPLLQRAEFFFSSPPTENSLLH